MKCKSRVRNVRGTTTSKEVNNMLYHEPAKAVLKILEILDENDWIELSVLFSIMTYSRKTILMGLGWLVLEGYVILLKGQNNCKVYLNLRAILSDGNTDEMEKIQKLR